VHIAIFLLAKRFHRSFVGDLIEQEISSSLNIVT